MSIKDFQSKIRNENGNLFQALRKLSKTEDPSKILDTNSQLVGWDVWPSLEVQASACA